jgi:hypothetical protein
VEGSNPGLENGYPEQVSSWSFPVLPGRIRNGTDRSREPGSSVRIVSDYGLDDRAIGARSPAGAKNFSTILCVQTGSGAHPASCTVGTGGPFPGGKSAAGA